MHTKRLLAVLCVACLSTAFAQTDGDDVDKPVSPTCGQPTESSGPTKAPPPEPDQPIDLTNPLLGFYQPDPGSVSPDKEAVETCADGEPYTPTDDGTDKSDVDGGRVLAPCAFPDGLIVQAGIRDHFSTDNDEPATLTREIIVAAGSPTNWTPFDAGSSDYHFGHHFALNFQNVGGYRYGTLTLHLMSRSSDLQWNDTISLWATGAPHGWGVALKDLGYDFVEDQETTVVLDLRSLQSGASNILNDVSTYGNLNVYIQDDTSVDDMTLQLSCMDPQTSVPLVGVVMGGRAGCGRLRAYDVFLDNEDRRNKNSRSGWIGATVSNKNTYFRLCGVDGREFTQAAYAGANFAVVSLAPGCPDGLTRFDRFHDNEDDNQPTSFDTAPNGSPTFTNPKKDTNFAFCVATSMNPGVSNTIFPNIGVSYGVFGGRTPALSRWAIDRGWLRLDDEDHNNQNRPDSPPSYTREFLLPGGNTEYWIARVK